MKAPLRMSGLRNSAALPDGSSRGSWLAGWPDRGPAPFCRSR